MEIGRKTKGGIGGRERGVDKVKYCGSVRFSFMKLKLQTKLNGAV
jgi:hypothetical protein